MRRISLWCLIAIIGIAPTPYKALLAQDEAQLLSKYRQAGNEGGDPKLGKLVFESDKSKCSVCHSVFSGAGDRRAGPPLNAVGDKFSIDQMMKSVLEPSAMIHPDYVRISVQTKDGTTIAGVLGKRADGVLELLDAEGKVQRIDLSNVEQEKNGGPSLMPQGIHATITTTEFANLIAYLGSLKQVVPDGRATPGLVDEIPILKQGIQLQPLNREEHRFDHPVQILVIPGRESEYVVVEQMTRRVWRFVNASDGDRKELFVDVSNESISGEFEGLVCLAFHPKFQENGRYYLNYHVREHGVFSPVVVERLASSDRSIDSGKPSRRLIQFKQDTDLHWGGMIAFGPDGYLYIGAGDGGPQEDPDGNGQNLKRWLGSILRIDVDHTSGSLPYGIPPSNPYAQSEVALPEIWASGFRMPWRFSFDGSNNDLWVGDIGQNLFEEVTIARIGEDHGWNVYEGFSPFSERYRRKGVNYVPPVVSYRRKHGVSVTGGYVYRGQRSESYRGVYVFGDFESKRIWGLTQENRKLIKIRQIGEASERIPSFGVDADGELLVVGYQGTIFRILLDNSKFE